MSNVFPEDSAGLTTVNRAFVNILLINPGCGLLNRLSCDICDEDQRHLREPATFCRTGFKYSFSVPADDAVEGIQQAGPQTQINADARPVI